MGVSALKARRKDTREEVDGAPVRDSNRPEHRSPRALPRVVSSCFRTSSSLKPIGHSRALLRKYSMLWTVFAIQLVGVPATSVEAGDIRVEIKVPKEAKVGSSVELGCEWRLFGGDGLYSVKWYKDDHEFFRYVPDDDPSIQTFPQPGVNIEKRRNSEKSIRLKNVEVASSGQYKCEVSTEAPSFATTYRAGNLTVIVLPERGPEISGLSSHYALGDNVTANCTVWPSVPRAAVRWFVNGKPIAKEKTIEYSGLSDSAAAASASLAGKSVGLRTELEPWHLERVDGPATAVAIKCMAEIGSNVLESEKMVRIAYVNKERLSSGDDRGGAELTGERSRVSVLALPLLLSFLT